MAAQRKAAVKERNVQAPARAAQPPARKPRATNEPAKSNAGGTTTKAAKAQEQQPSVLRQRTERVAQIARDTRSELRKVTWPDRETTRRLTLLVIGVAIVLGLLLGGIDFGLLKLFEAL